MKDRFCPYCRTFKPDVGFRQVRHPSNRSSRCMCASCQELRKRPQAELQALADKAREERKKK